MVHCGYYTSALIAIQLLDVIQFSSEVYRNGRGICNTLWGGSFFYSNYNSNDTDGVRQCLVPYFGINETNPNSVVIEKFFANGGHTLNVGSALLLAAALIVVMTLLM